MRTLFITATDTNVGKTVITGLIARYLNENNINVITQKWVQTGFNSKLDKDNDINTHFNLMGKNISNYIDLIDYICPYCFSFPGSPHLAAKLEKAEIKYKVIKKSLKQLINRFDFVLIEGSGGLFVPINEKTLLINFIKKLNIPVLLVVGNKLGAINHTLLSIFALKKMRMSIKAIIFNNLYPNENETILTDNVEIIKKNTGIKNIFSLSYCKDFDKLYNEFVKNTESFLKDFKNAI